MSMSRMSHDPIRPETELENSGSEPARRGPVRRLLRWGGFAVVLAIALLFGGFLLFADCCVDIGYDALDTIGNAEEATNWIHAKGYTSVLIVTNNYHMPRSLAELAYVDPETRFVPYPVVNTDLKNSNWFTDPNAMRVMLAEYGKLLFAGARNLTGLFRHPGLRSAEGDT
jgi:hypothetical protein